jgi:predicted DNA binding CopG/RHH family protein
MPRETAINVRLSFQEKEAIEAKAERDTLPLAEWLRLLALADDAKVDRPVKVRP